MSDTIQSAEAFAEELQEFGNIAKIPKMENIQDLIQATARLQAEERASWYPLIKSRDADIRAAEARKQAERFASCVEALKEYIVLLTEEISSLVVFAEEHGCRSDQYDAGVNARARIDQALADLEATK
jgi:hypothetical protein